MTLLLLLLNVRLGRMQHFPSTSQQTEGHYIMLVPMHLLALSILWSKATDIPNVDFPVPGDPAISINFGGLGDSRRWKLWLCTRDQAWTEMLQYNSDSSIRIKAEESIYVIVRMDFGMDDEPPPAVAMTGTTSVPVARAFSKWDTFLAWLDIFANDQWPFHLLTNVTWRDFVQVSGESVNNLGDLITCHLSCHFRFDWI